MSMTNLKESHLTSLDIRFLRRLTGDKAGRTGWMKVQRTFLGSIKEIILYPIGQRKMPEDSKQENSRAELDL